MPRRRISVALLGLLVLVVAGWLGQTVLPEQYPAAEAPPAAPQAGLSVRALSELPPQATAVWRQIQDGGPFRYEQDGRVFANREGLLPERSSGFYREYTVPTPGEDDRGARRLVTGQRGELYYTGDHYASFVVVDPHR